MEKTLDAMLKEEQANRKSGDKTIVQLRTENRLTLKEVSDGTGIPYGTYKAYDYGYRKVPLSAAKKIAKFYGISVDNIKE